MVTIELENLDKAFAGIMNDLVKSSREVVAKTVQAMPRRMEAEAKARFMDVLTVRSGQLRGHIEGFLRREDSNTIAIGLRDDKKYALIQHEGGLIPPHVIRPRVKKALFWQGARHPVKKVNHPGGKIKATKFLERPMLTVAGKAMEFILKNIRFKK